MAIDDNTTYGLTGAQVKDLAQRIQAGGSGPTVVQTTGESTTDVMSQKAVTSMVFQDPSTRYNVQIGYNSSNTGTNGTAVGNASNIISAYNGTALGTNASCQHRGSVALGSSSATTAKGQIYVGTTNPYDGYNSTNYRLVSGVHDPVEAQDAATKAYVDSATPTITMQATDPGEGATLAANHFIAVY